MKGALAIWDDQDPEIRQTHQLRLVVYPIIYKVLGQLTWLFGISEPFFQYYPMYHQFWFQILPAKFPHLAASEKVRHVQIQRSFHSSGAGLEDHTMVIVFVP